MSPARLFAAAVVAATLAGCSVPGPPKADEEKVAQFAQHGYQPGDRLAVATVSPAWIVGGDSHPVTLTLPDKGGPFPLVIYLPALGESHKAGNVWRQAWTRAGFAVLSIQPLAEDEGAWSSRMARTGDFAGMARQRYAPASMAARIDALQAVWHDLVRRHAAAEAPLGMLDLSRVAIAGYDLGAYAAMTIAGEGLKNVPAPPNAIPVRAVIALSPYADFSGLAFAERYRGIAVPVLSVTTDSDTDPMGVVTSPSVRKAPFEYMPPGDKFLVLLWGVPHFVLAGNETSAEARAADGQAERFARETEAQSRGSRGSGGSRRGGAQPGSPVQQGIDDGTFGMGETRMTATSNAIASAAIAGITTAYLDAYLKNDGIAREWLLKDAARWLKDRGELKRK